MPKQSRGFWTCDFCSGTFDTYEDASLHETYDCTRRHPEGAYAHPSRSSIRQPNETAAASLPYGVPHPSYGYRRFLFMGQDSGRLTRDDATMCRNIEIFEVDTPNTTDSMGARIPLGTIGLRCIHCIGDRSAAPGNANFPRCIADIGDFLREIAEGHLWRCERAPSSVKQILQQALHVRQQAKQERGHPWFIQENSRRLLLDYCAFMARELRLVDKYPANSGVMFQPSEISHMRQHAREQISPLTARRYSRSDGSQSIPAQPQMRPAQPPLPHPPPQAPHVASPVRSGQDRTDYDHLSYGMQQFDSPPQKDDGEPEPLPINYQAESDERQDSAAPYESIPVHFPFTYEPSGRWVCKFCQHVHPQYKDPQYQWSATNNQPPPAHYIDHHLSLCRMYQQSLMQDYQGPSPPSRGFGLSFQDPQSAHPGDYGPFPASPPFSPPVASYSDGGGTPSRHTAVDTPATRAMALLDSNDLSTNYMDGTPVPVQFMLVVDDDRLLLTDYYYYLMKQLRHCEFAESDRKTRGGKRDSVEVGYGGLQCVHCAKLPNARKFFWGSVDRLANSFAEIPTHILKCRGCPRELQDALSLLKEQHQDQMSRLPRGSQKVYFRRMWRRIHPNQQLRVEQQQEPRIGEAAIPAATNSSPVREQPRTERLDPFTTQKLTLAVAGSPSEESVMLLERSPREAARALADATIQDGPLSPSSRVLLSIPNDKEWLSNSDTFVRQQIEVFCTAREEMDTARSHNKVPVEEGTVGIRCIHCAISKRGGSAHSTFYPFSITGLYEAVRELHRLHLDNCENAPAGIKSKLTALKGFSFHSSDSSAARNYYVTAAKSLGLVDTKHGIRATGESVPLSSRPAFCFSEQDLGGTRGSPLNETDGFSSPSITPRKRSYSEPSIHPSEENNKRASFASAGLSDMNIILRGSSAPERKDSDFRASPPFDDDKEHEAEMSFPCGNPSADSRVSRVGFSQEDSRQESFTPTNELPGTDDKDYPLHLSFDDHPGAQSKTSEFPENPSSDIPNRENPVAKDPGAGSSV